MSGFAGSLSYQHMDVASLHLGFVGFQPFRHGRRHRCSRRYVEQPLMQRTFDGLAVDITFRQKGVRMRANAGSRVKLATQIEDRNAGAVVFDAGRIIDWKAVSSDRLDPMPVL